MRAYCIAQCSVLCGDITGKEMPKKKKKTKRGYMYTTAGSLCCMVETTQHCKATILQ